MTALRLPDGVSVSPGALVVIADALGIDVTELAVARDGTAGRFDLKAGGWVYERADDTAPTAAGLPAGVDGWPTGTRWTGGAQ